MTQVFLTSASTSPWSKPGDWQDAGHTVELVGAGGNGSVGNTGTGSTPGNAGGGGGYYKLTYSSGAMGASTPFAIGARGSATSTTSHDTGATFWEGTTTTNTYEAQAGLQGAATGSGTVNAAGGSAVTNGSPSPIVYTTAINAGGSGGSNFASSVIGSGGGGGAGGPSGVGGNGGFLTTGGQAGCGGAGSNGGASPGQWFQNTGQAGGNGFGGTGGGAGGTPTGAGNATANSGGGGGGGGLGAAAPTNTSGGSGAGDQTFDASHGSGGGGGSGGPNGVNTPGNTTNGGNGGDFGGGGGPSAGTRSTTSTRTAGTGGGGLIVITYTAVAAAPIWGWDQQEGGRITKRNFPRERRSGGIMRGIDGTDAPFVQFINPGGAVLPPSPLRQPPRTNTRGAILKGDEGNEAPFILFQPSGWEVQPPQPPHPRPETRAGGIMRGDDGSENPFIRFQPDGWEQTASQDRHPRSEKAGAMARGDDGTELPIPPPTTPWGYDVQQQPVRNRLARAAGIAGKSQFALFGLWQNFGFDQVNSQEPRRRWERSGALARGDDGTEAPLSRPTIPWGYDVQQQPTREWPWRQRIGAMARGDDGTESPFVQFFPVGWEQVASQDRHPTLLHRPGAIFRGNDGTESPFAPPPIPWFEVTPPFLAHPRPERNGALARWVDGTLPFVQFIPDGWEQVFAQPRYRWFKSPETGDAGIASPFVQFLPVGFDQVASQDAHRRFERAGALARWLDGIESPFRPPSVAFFDVTASQPLFPRTRTYGALMPRADGIESPFVQFLPVGFDEVFSQDRHPRPERFGAIARGHDGIEFPMPPAVPPWFETTPALTRRALFRSPEIGDPGIASPFVQFFPAGWDQVTSQPLHRLFKSPDVGDGGIASPFTLFVPHGWPVQPPQPPHPRPERAGAIMLGDPGIENTFTAVGPVVFVGWGFDAQSPQPPHLRAERSGAVQLGDAGIASPLVQFFPAGFDQVFAPPPHRWFKQPEFGDPGIASPLIVFTPTEWPWTPHYAHPRPERSGALARGDYGFELLAAPPLFPWFETSPVLARHALFKSPEFGDAGIARPFVPPTPPWFEVTPPLLFHRGLRSPEFGDAGIASPLIRFLPFEWPSVPIHQHPRPERSGAVARWEDGIARPFVPPVPWFETSPPLTRHAMFRSPEFGDQGIQSRLIVPFPEGWQVQPPQPPHPRPERAGSIQVGDTGIENTFTAVGPTVFVNWGFDAVYPPQPPHPRRERSGAVMLGDPGTQARFVPPVVFVNWGFDVTPVQPPHRRVERFAAIKGRITLPVFAPFIKSGFDQVFTQPPHPRPERIGVMVGDTGTQAQFVFVPLPRWGFDLVPPLVARPASLQKLAALVRGDDGIAATPITFYPQGWPIQPWQPPHPRPERSGAIMRGDEGIETPFGFIPPIVYVGWGFEPTPSPQPPHPRRERAGALMRGSEIESRFVFVPPPVSGWEIQSWQPPHLRRERSGALAKGDEGTQARLIRFVPLLQEPTPPLFFRRPLPRVPVFMLDSVEQFGIFVPTIAPSVVCVRIAPYGATTTIGAMELKTIIKAFKATTIIKRQDCT